MKKFLFNCEGDKYVIEAESELKAKQILKERHQESFYNYVKELAS